MEVSVSAVTEFCILEKPGNFKQMNNCKISKTTRQWK